MQKNYAIFDRVCKSRLISIAHMSDIYIFTLHLMI